MAHAATPFGAGYGRTRFASPNGAFKVIYLAQDLTTSVAETLVRDVSKAGPAGNSCWQKLISGGNRSERVDSLHSYRSQNNRGAAARCLHRSGAWQSTRSGPQTEPSGVRADQCRRTGLPFTPHGSHLRLPLRTCFAGILCGVCCPAGRLSCRIYPRFAGAERHPPRHALRRLPSAAKRLLDDADMLLQPVAIRYGFAVSDVLRRAFGLTARNSPEP